MSIEVVVRDRDWLALGLRHSPDHAVRVEDLLELLYAVIGDHCKAELERPEGRTPLRLR